MSDTLLFVLLFLLILLGYSVWVLRKENWVEYFTTDAGKKILRGVVLAPIILLIIALSFKFVPQARAGTWVNDASIFAGLDVTAKESPQCERNRVDNRGTSNLGVKLNIWESDSGNVRINSKYTHHSCALGPDDRQYDGVGVELEWKVWRRRM